MEIPQMPASLKEHILSIWTKNCKGKGQDKEEKYDYDMICFVMDTNDCQSIQMSSAEDGLGLVWRGDCS